ncbi:MAG: PQ-loop repeat-containing protein [Parachlamydiales bacterium]
MTFILDTLSWIAIAALSIGYWLQIWKIYVHKEVRDLSLPYHILQAVGFAILGITAYMENSMIFLTKQITSTIPVVIIIGQILYHKGDKWHEVGQEENCQCGSEIDASWTYCPFCAKRVGRGTPD